MGNAREEENERSRRTSKTGTGRADGSGERRVDNEATDEGRAGRRTGVEDASDGGGGGRETAENRGEEKRAERTGAKTSRDATTGTDGPRCKVETRGGRVRPVRGLSGRDAFRRRLPRGRGKRK